jgi:RNA recognition motif-containing protein
MTVYIGNLAYEAGNEQLRELVEATAAVKHVTVVRDRQSGRSKGFAFVNLQDEAEEERVIETLEGQEFMGRNLRVVRAHARTLRIPQGLASFPTQGKDGNPNQAFYKEE